MDANQRQATEELINSVRLASFFAGEGSISIAGNTVLPKLEVAIGNTERVWVVQYHEQFGGYFGIEKPKYLGAKYIFRWKACGEKAYRFLKQIEPFLIGEKLKQLQLGLKFQEYKDANRCSSGTRYVSQRFEPEVKKVLKGFQEELKLLRRAAAETNRKDASPAQNDSPTLVETPVSKV